MSALSMNRVDSIWVKVIKMAGELSQLIAASRNIFHLSPQSQINHQT